MGGKKIRITEGDIQFILTHSQEEAYTYVRNKYGIEKASNFMKVVDLAAQAEANRILKGMKGIEKLHPDEIKRKIRQKVDFEAYDESVRHIVKRNLIVGALDRRLAYLNTKYAKVLQLESAMLEQKAKELNQLASNLDKQLQKDSKKVARLEYEINMYKITKEIQKLSINISKTLQSRLKDEVKGMNTKDIKSIPKNLISDTINIIKEEHETVESNHIKI